MPYLALMASASFSKTYSIEREGSAYINECVTDDLSLLLRVSDTLEEAEEEVRGVHKLDINTRGSEGLDDLLGLVESQDTVVDEDGVESLADGSVEEDGSDGGIDTTTDGANDVALLADLLADSLDGLLDKGTHAPISLAADNVDGEVLEEDLAERGVSDLGVELDAVATESEAGEGHT